MKYAGVQYVAVGGNGFSPSSISTSTDGLNWVSRTSPTTRVLNSVDYQNSVYVAAGAFGTLLSSTDAITWTIRQATITTLSLNCLAYNSTTYKGVVVGNTGLIETSTDATTWYPLSGTFSNINCVSHAFGTSATYPYLIAGDGGFVGYSTSGNGYVTSNTGTTTNLRSITYNSKSSTYVAAGDNGIILTTTDFVSWNTRTSNTASTIYSLTYSATTGAVSPLATAVGAGGYFSQSADGTYWSVPTTFSTSFAVTQNSLIYSGSLFVAAGASGGIVTSTDANTWVSRTSGTASAINSLVYGNSLYVYGGDGGVLATSTDATTWTARTSGTTSNIRALAYADGATNKYVFGDAAGTFKTSTDGITWTTRTTIATMNTVIGIAYGNSTYVAISSTSGNVITSTDGVTWTTTSTLSITAQSLIYANGIFMAGGNTGALRTSTNGVTWSTQSFGSTPIIYALAYNNGTFYAASGTTYGFVYYSNNNGASWALSNGTIGLGFARAAAVGNGNIVIGNSNNLGIYSLNAVTYNLSTQFVVPTAVVNQYYGGPINSAATLYVKAL
jgi:hypothetical protein